MEEASNQPSNHDILLCSYYIQKSSLKFECLIFYIICDKLLLSMIIMLTKEHHNHSIILRIIGF